MARDDRRRRPLRRAVPPRPERRVVRRSKRILRRSVTRSSFREWDARGTIRREAGTRRLADRFDAAGGAITSARSYFDTLALGGR